MESPKMRLTLKLTDGTQRSKVCDWQETVETLAAAKCFPGLADFDIVAVELDSAGQAQAGGREIPLTVAEMDELEESVRIEKSDVDAPEAA